MSDRVDVLYLWSLEKKWLGNGGLAWKRYVERVSGTAGVREYWVKAIAGEDNALLGFAHYLVRLDGWRSLYEIAVHPTARKYGIGRTLIETIGFPMRLKTDANNEASNAFYLRLGFRCVGAVTSKNGQRRLNVYERFE